MSSVSKPRVRHNRHKQGLNLTLEKLSADFRTKRLEAIFNVKIIVDEKLVGHCSYTGALYGGSLQQILDNMTFVSNIKYTIKDSGKTVIIESK